MDRFIRRIGEITLSPFPVRMRRILQEKYGDIPGVRIDQTIPGTNSALWPDLYCPDLDGRKVIFDVGGPSKVGDISKYNGMADDLFPLVPKHSGLCDGTARGGS